MTFRGQAALSVGLVSVLPGLVVVSLLLPAIHNQAFGEPAAPGRELVFGGDDSFPPYEFLNARGEPSGLNVDLIRAVARSQGFRVRIVLEPWRLVPTGLAEGRIDIAAMYRSPQRALNVDFAIPHELIYHEMYVRAGSPMLHSLAGLMGKRILVETHTVQMQTLIELGFGEHLRETESEPEALRALARGEGEVAIVAQASTRPFQYRSEWQGKIVPTGPPVLLTEYAFVTAKGRRALIEKLNQGVAEVKASGEYQRMFDRWLRPDASASRLRRIAWFAAAILGMALLVVAWNYVLRKRVTEQDQEIGQLGTSYRKLADYQAEIDRANQELEAFSYSVSHDLRAPLRAVKGFSEMLMEDYGTQLDEEGRRLCQVICDNVQQMGQLIDDLLSLSRLSRAPMSKTDVDMREMVEGEYQKVSVPSIRFELGALPSTQGDARLLRQVWANLLSNAVKFTAKADAPLIQVTGEEKAGECIYTVRDNGTGFNMQHADKLFEVFQRLHSASEFEGTGVGLAIVKRIVSRHGGRVWAESEVGQGATFHFTLPKNDSRS